MLTVKRRTTDVANPSSNPAKPVTVRLCHWCAFNVEPGVYRPEDNLTPFGLDLPCGMKGFWCNGSCAASWFLRHRREMGVGRYLGFFHEALHHTADVTYDYAPEPFLYEWFDPASQATRRDFLAKCSYRIQRTQEAVSFNAREPVSYSLQSLFRRAAPDAAPPIPFSPPQPRTFDPRFAVSLSASADDVKEITPAGSRPPKAEKERRRKRTRPAIASVEPETKGQISS